MPATICYAGRIQLAATFSLLCLLHISLKPRMVRGILESAMKEQYPHHSPPVRYAYLLAAGKAGLEVIGTTSTSFPSGKTVAYGFNDQYGFNVLGQAIINRDGKWRKRAYEVPTYRVKENEA